MGYNRVFRYQGGKAGTLTYRQFVACILIYLDLEKGESEDSIESYSEGTWSHVQSEDEGDEIEEVEEADAVVSDERYCPQLLIGIDVHRSPYCGYEPRSLWFQRAFIHVL